MTLISNFSTLPQIIIDIVKPKILVKFFAKLATVHNDHSIWLKCDQLSPFGRAWIVF